MDLDLNELMKLYSLLPMFLMIFFSMIILSVLLIIYCNSVDSKKNYLKNLISFIFLNISFIFTLIVTHKVSGELIHEKLIEGTCYQELKYNEKLIPSDRNIKHVENQRKYTYEKIDFLLEKVNPKDIFGLDELNKELTVLNYYNSNVFRGMIMQYNPRKGVYLVYEDGNFTELGLDTLVNQKRIVKDCSNFKDKI